MHSNQFRRTRVAAAIAGVVLALGAGQALGAAFALQTQNGSGLGNAYAGGAAAAEDASTVWSNPAGMARFSTIQLVGAINAVTPSIKFNDDGSLHAFNQPLGGTGGDAGGTGVIPALYVVVPINQQFALGLGVNAPFGLKTDWDSGWLGRYQGLYSKVETINVNPALSWRIVPNFTVGVGVDWQKVKATLTSNFNYSAGLAQGAQQAAAAGLIPPSSVAPFVAATGGLDSNVKLTGNDDAWGWDIGAMWDITPDTRLGAHYRSSIKYNVSGNVQIDNPTLPPLGPLAPIGAAVSAGVNAALASGGVTLALEVPATTNVSIFSHHQPEVGCDGRRAVDAVVVVRGIGAHPYRPRQTHTGDARKLQGCLARVRGYQLLLRRQLEIPRRPGLGPDAGAGCLPDARDSPTTTASGSRPARSIRTASNGNSIWGLPTSSFRTCRRTRTPATRLPTASSRATTREAC